MQSYRSPRAHWFGSPNFTRGRSGHDMTQPSWVVLHTMVGWVGGANARFQQSSEQASATYGVGLDGALYQWVDEADAAWANGATGRGGRGDNLDSISIEHEDGGRFDDPRPDVLYASSSALVRDVCLRYSIPIDRAHVIGHRECDFSSTACPDALDMDRIVAGAMTGGDDVDPTLAAKLDQLANVLLSGGDNRVQNPAIFAALAAIRGDDKGLLAAIQAGQVTLTAVSTQLAAIKAEIEAGGSVDAAAVLARIEHALQAA